MENDAYKPQTFLIVVEFIVWRDISRPKDVLIYSSVPRPSCCKWARFLMWNDRMNECDGTELGTDVPDASILLEECTTSQIDPSETSADNLTQQ